MSFKKFLTRYSDELANVTQVLSVIVSALPIDRQDKRNVSRVLEGLSKSAERVAASVSGMPEIEAPAKPDDLRAAVVSALPGLMGDIVEGVFREAKRQETPLVPPLPKKTVAPLPKKTVTPAENRAERRKRAIAVAIDKGK